MLRGYVLSVLSQAEWKAETKSKRGTPWLITLGATLALSRCDSLFSRDRLSLCAYLLLINKIRNYSISSDYILTINSLQMINWLRTPLNCCFKYFRNICNIVL